MIRPFSRGLLTRSSVDSGRPPFTSRRFFAFQLCFLAVLGTGCSERGIGADPRWGRPDAIRARPEWVVLTPAFRIAAPEIGETSGMVCLGGSYFVHNDSGDRPRLFRASRLDFSDVEELAAPGAQAIDWEEITTYRGDLLVCDTGDNRTRRSDVTLYRYRYVPGALSASSSESGSRRESVDSGGLRESGDSGPTATQRIPGRLELRGRYPVRYPDAPHDVEAAFTIDDHLYLVTKDRGEGTWVMRFDSLRDANELSGNSANVPEKIGKLDLGGEQVTGAAYDPRHDAVLLLTYSGISVYPARQLEGRPARTTRIWARQAEAICVQGDSIIFANEQRDVFVLDRFLEAPRAEALPLAGSTTLRSAFSSRKSEESGSVPEITIDGDASEWTDHASSLPLRNASPAESFRWMNLRDRILVCARVHLEVAPEPADPESLRTGSGILLSFAESDRRSTFLDGSQTQLFIGAATASGAPVWRLSFRGYDLASMTPVESSVAASFVDLPGPSGPGWLAFEASIPVGAIWPVGSLPEQFLFDLQGIGLREGEELHFSAADLYSIYRPYAWGNVSLVQ